MCVKKKRKEVEKKKGGGGGGKIRYLQMNRSRRNFTFQIRLIPVRRLIMRR